MPAASGRKARRIRATRSGTSEEKPDALRESAIPNNVIGARNAHRTNIGGPNAIAASPRNEWEGGRRLISKRFPQSRPLASRLTIATAVRPRMNPCGDPRRSHLGSLHSTTSWGARQASNRGIQLRRPPARLRRPCGTISEGPDRVVGRPCGAMAESSREGALGPGVHEKLLGSSGYGNGPGPSQAVFEGKLA